MRVWCMIDTLLTSATITDALVETKRRLEQNADDEELGSLEVEAAPTDPD